jgi:16S rRNA G966 N2-methylase RsmD
MNSWDIKNKNLSRIKRIFPYLNHNDIYKKILIDDISFSYITLKEVSEDITKIITLELIEMCINPLKVKLIDYTAGVGGNVISFSSQFQEIIAIEISTLRASYLTNNLELYNIKNVKVINDCSIKYNENNVIYYSPTVFFFDPPWGDEWKKDLVNHKITFGNIKLEDFILSIYDKIELMYNNYSFNNYNNKLIVLKLPKNYDIKYLYQNTKKFKNDNYQVSINLYILNKMLIVVYKIICNL